MKWFFISFLLILGISNIYADHSFYYMVYNSTLCSEEFLSRSQIKNNDYLVLRWDDYFNDKTDKILLYYDIFYSSGNLGDLDYETVINAIKRAMKTWNNVPSDKDYYPFLKASSDMAAVSIYYTDDKSKFKFPDDDVARTPIAYGWDGSNYSIVTETNDPLPTSGGTFNKTELYFNNTTNFTFHNKWVDKANAHFDPNSNDKDQREVDVESIALHELGHLLGLRHYPYDNSVVMYNYYLGGRRNLTDLDKENFCNLYLMEFVTGIEDEVVISDENPNILTPGNNYTYYAYFIDYSPIGDYITNWNWRFEGELIGGGSELWDSGQTTGNYSTYWHFSVPYFDPNKNWVLDENGRVFSKVTVSARDNDGIWHTDIYYVGVNFPPSLQVTISGPTSLNSGQSGTYTAHPSGGSGTYTNYEWWEMRNNDVPMSPAGGNGILAPPSNQWVYLTGGPDKQQITISRTYSFSLKCIVTDSYNDQATSNILSIHVSGGALAKQNSEQTLAIAVQVPKKVELNGNFPNPFNPTTTIKFGLPEDAYVQLTIYSMSGQKVRTLLDGQVSKGYHQLIWDGTNESGQPVSGGLYVYELRARNKRLLKKMLLVK